jgi:hypothetical protein
MMCLSFHRSNDFPHIAAEVKGTRERVGVTEIANFAKYEVTGAGAEAWLDRLMTNRMPREGRIVLTPMLNHNGKLIGDFTIAKAALASSSSGAALGRRAIICAGLKGSCPLTARSGCALAYGTGGPVDRRAEIARGAGGAGGR